MNLTLSLALYLMGVAIFMTGLAVNFTAISFSECLAYIVVGLLGGPY